MKAEIWCVSCETPHLDRYECDNCHNHLHGSYTCGGCRERTNHWFYCPYCGEPLEDNDNAGPNLLHLS